MNSPVIDIRLKNRNWQKKTDDDDKTDIPPQFDEFDNAVYFDNDKLTAEDLNRNIENEVTADTDKTPKSKYYIKWSNAYKEACRIIYNKSSKSEDFKKAEQLLLSEPKNVLAIWYRKAIFHR